MAEETRHLNAPAVDWQVVAVFDPERQKPDFAYTVGLAARGLPELHMWARPSEGTDPGDDWAFNPRECTALLNRFARRLIDGQLAPSATWTDEMDFGLTTVTFTVGDPVDPDTVEAHLTAEGATVLPVRFALHREPRRDGGEVDEVATAEISSWTADVVTAVIATGSTVPPASMLPAVPYDTSAGQPFGPATPLLTTIRAAVQAAAPEQLADAALLGMLLETGSSLSSRAVLGATAAYGRVAGRDVAVTAARNAGLEDAQARAAEPDVDAELLALMGETPGSPAADRSQHAVGQLLAHVLAAAYTTAAVVDVLRADVRAAGFAPVLTAVCDGGLPRLWFAPEVAERVRARLADLTAADLRRLVAGVDGTLEAAEAVQVAALLAAADCPPVAEFLAGTPTLAAAQALARTGDVAWPDTLRALADVARALAHPQAAGADQLTGALPPQVDAVH